MPKPVFRAVTSAEMQALDRKAIEEYSIPSLLLMENAGRGVADIICQISSPPKAILIFCGKGNNGGDGLVTARYLWNRGFQIKILLFTDAARLKEDPAVNFKIAEKMKIPMETIPPNPSAEFFLQRLKKVDLVVDALFGVGLERELEEPYLTAIEMINEARKQVVAIDVPSGLNADTGQVMGIAVNAFITATLGLPKRGLFEREGPLCAGQIEIVDIGLPRQILQGADF